MPLSVSSVVNFLTKSPDIDGLNFSFLHYKISPTDYRVAVATAFRDQTIRLEITDKLPNETYLQYDPDQNVLRVRSTYEINGIDPMFNRGIMIHESTHAYLDMQKLGTTPVFESEALAYAAEAIFWERSGVPYTPSAADKSAGIRSKAQAIAQGVIAGKQPKVPSNLAVALVSEIAKSPHYRYKVPYTSNG